MNEKKQEKEYTGGIECPFCGSVCKGEIIDVRRTSNGKRRRRICELCGKRFTTFEFPIKGRNIKIFEDMYFSDEK